MGIDKQSEIAANLQIGPTSLGMVRIYIEADGVDLPLDFEPEEAEEIAEELRAAAERARAMGGTAPAPKALKGGGAETEGRIAQRLKAQRGVAGEFLHHHLAPRGGERRLRPHAQDLGVIGVGQDQPGPFGQQVGREIGIDRPEEAVAPVQIALPLAVAAEVGAARLAFDHPDLALRPQCHHVDPQARRRHQFLDGDEIMAEQMAAQTPRQKLAGQRRVGRVAERKRPSDKYEPKVNIAQALRVRAAQPMSWSGGFCPSRARPFSSGR